MSDTPEVKTIYISSDGIQFDNEIEMLRYENYLNNEIERNEMQSKITAIGNNSIAARKKRMWLWLLFILGLFFPPLLLVLLVILIVNYIQD
jgi:hypothetical protein